MKGKGHEVTARNIALGDVMELSRPLTTDEWDNALLYEEQETEADNGDRRQDGFEGGGNRQPYVLIYEQDNRDRLVER